MKVPVPLDFCAISFSSKLISLTWGRSMPGNLLRFWLLRLSYYNKEHISNVLHLGSFIKLKSVQILSSVQQWPVAINLYFSPTIYALVAVTLPDLNFKIKHNISQVQLCLHLGAILCSLLLWILSNSSGPAVLGMQGSWRAQKEVSVTERELRFGGI